MRHNPAHAETDEREVRRLIAENPWITIVSQTDDGIVASHYPAMLAEDDDSLTIITHVGRPDERVHDFGDREVLVIASGPHGYISPSWYSPHAIEAPTWNFSVAHCYGVPETLGLEENKRALARLVERFERLVDRPLYLSEATADRFAPGTVGLRIPITRWVCKVKMSQDKDAQSQRQVMAALGEPGPYANPPLAAEMGRALADS
jgi:transcriptional regulator